MTLELAGSIRWHISIVRQDNLALRTVEQAKLIKRSGNCVKCDFKQMRLRGSVASAGHALLQRRGQGAVLCLVLTHFDYQNLMIPRP